MAVKEAKESIPNRQLSSSQFVAMPFSQGARRRRASRRPRHERPSSSSHSNLRIRHKIQESRGRAGAHQQPYRSVSACPRGGALP